MRAEPTLELGSLDVVVRTEIANRVFDEDPNCTFDLWFTAGNHEDFDELKRFARAPGKTQPESGSVGVLEWGAGEGTFAFIDDADLKPFTRHNWKWV